MKATKTPPSHRHVPTATISNSHEDKVERMNHLAFFFFMGALLIGFIVVALAAFLYW
jgi:hypothetical protein